MKMLCLILALLLAAPMCLCSARAEGDGFLDVGEQTITLSGDFSAEITLRHTLGQALEGGLRVYVQGRDYYAFFLRWREDSRCEFYAAKYANNDLVGYLIAEEYLEDPTKTSFISSNESWNAAYDSAMTLRVTVRGTVATVTMTGADSGQWGRLHFDLTRSPCLNGKPAEAEPTLWQTGLLKAAASKSKIVSFRVDEGTWNGLAAVLPQEEEKEMQQIRGDFIPGSFTDENGVTVPYQLHVPEHLEEGKTYPLFLFMHGAGENGADNIQVISGNGIFTIANRILELGKECFILAPQSQVNWMQIPLPRRPRPSFTMDSASPSRYLLCALSLLESVEQQYPVDQSRVYYCGYSAGAIAGYYLLGSGDERFAAAILCVGVGSPEAAANIAKTPIYVYHGTLDDIVSYPDDKALCDRVAALGGEVVFIVCEGSDHGVFSDMRKDPNVIDWLFSKKRP